jgi:5,10-methylenetetrahydrofolate reductase
LRWSAQVIRGDIFRVLRLSDLIRDSNFVRIVEVFPPGFPSPEGNHRPAQKYDLVMRFEQLAESIARIESIADAFSIPELKEGSRIHLNSVGIASELKKKTGNDVIPTLTLRDSNVQNLLGTISFAMFAGLENILVVRGDPFVDENAKRSSKNVYELGKVSTFVRAIRAIESSISLEHSVCLLSPINLLRSEDPKYVSTIKERERSGVDVFLAEQMFEDIDTYLGRLRAVRKAGISKPIVHSIFPLKSYADALFCEEKFGWKIPSAELSKLKMDGSVYGLEMARRRYRWLLDNSPFVEGVSISTRGNPEVARFVTG